MISFDYARTEAGRAAAAYNERARVGTLRTVRALDVLIGGIVAGRLSDGPYEATVVDVEILDYRGPNEARRFKLANGVSFTLPATDPVTARMPAAEPLPMALPPGTRCGWFAACQNEATHIEAHPILSGVPACDRCPQIGRC